MGKKDTITKEYMSTPEYFADAFNSSVFHGKQVVKADELHLREIDPTEMGIIIKEDAKDIVQKVRDVLKKSVIMSDGHVSYLLLGIENQSEIHYAMPVKNLIYDALNYGQQVNRIALRHRKAKDVQNAEYLSGFAKEDKIIPVITLTVYFGSKEWDAPRSLKEMFPAGIDDEILKEVDDYRLHLIVPTEIRDYSLFRTEFGKVMRFIAAAEDPEEMEKLSKDTGYEAIRVESVNVINECTGAKIPTHEGEEVVNVCKGIEGYAEKYAEKCRIEQIEGMLKRGKTEKEIADFCGYDLDEVKKIKEQMMCVC